MRKAEMVVNERERLGKYVRVRRRKKERTDERCNMQYMQMSDARWMAGATKNEKRTKQKR